jgi:hypothetical protein
MQGMRINLSSPLVILWTTKVNIQIFHILPTECDMYCVWVSEEIFFFISPYIINPLTPELNPSAQRCLTRFLTGDFAYWTLHFVNVCVKNQQIQQLFIQFIDYNGSSYMFRHYIAIFKVRVVTWCSCASRHQTQHAHPQYSIDCSSIEHLSQGTRNAPWGWQCNAETFRSYHT